MNKRPRKVLIVEDDKMLQTVFQMFVNDLGHDVVGAYTTAEEGLKACETSHPDVVLLDIHLPGKLKGVNAANRFYTQYNIPVIYISGYADDETVNEAINFSIFGYLVKPIDKIALGITIDLVCWRHEFEQLKKINEQLIEYIEQAVFTISFSGKVLYANRKFYSLLKQEEGKELFLHEILELDEEDFQRNVIEQVLKLQYLNSVFKVKKLNKYIQCSFSLLFDEINEVYAIAVYANDITTLIEFSEGFKKIGAIQTSFINSSSQIILIFDRFLSLKIYNEQAKNFFKQKLGIVLNENDSLSDIFGFFQPNEIVSLTNNIFDGVFHFTERTIEYQNIKSYIQINWIPVKIDENVEYVLLLINDISRLRQLEIDYEEQKNELKPIFDSSIQRFYLVDLNLNIIAFNKAARDIIYKEFNRTLKKGDNALDLVPQKERKEHFLQQFELAKQGHSVSFKESYPIKNEIRWNETHLDPVINERGEINRVLIWTLDVTEREQYLQDLKESQQRYELIARGGSDGIFDWDMIKNTVYLSPRWKALLGYQDHELKNEFGVRDSLIHPDDKERANKVLNDYLEGKTSIYENEFRLRHKNGEYIWIIERGELLRDEEGRNIRFAGSITDVTRLKNIEANLIRLNKTLLDERKMFMQGSVVITRIKADESKRFIYISENVKQVLGYAVEDFISGKITYDELIHPEDYQMHINERNEAIKNNIKQISFSPYRMYRSDGTYIWVKDFSLIVQNEEDNTNDILGYFIDITEQKRSELELLESNKRYFALFEEAGDAIILIDEIKIIEANKNAENLFGYSKEELKKMDIFQLSPEKQHNGEYSTDRFNKKLLNIMTGESKTFYWQFINKENKIIDTDVSINPIVLNNKRILYQAIIRNITERKKIERALKESERRIKALLEAIPDLLFILDKNNTYIYFKPDREKKFDVPSSEVIGKNISDFFKDEVYEQYIKCIERCRQTGETVEITYELNSPIGKRKYEARLSPLQNDEILQVVRDLGPVN